MKRNVRWHWVIWGILLVLILLYIRFPLPENTNMHLRQIVNSLGIGLISTLLISFVQFLMKRLDPDLESQRFQSCVKQCTQASAVFVQELQRIPDAEVCNCQVERDTEAIRDEIADQTPLFGAMRQAIDHREKITSFYLMAHKLYRWLGNPDYCYRARLSEFIQYVCEDCNGEVKIILLKEKEIAEKSKARINGNAAIRRAKANGYSNIHQEIRATVDYLTTLTRQYSKLHFQQSEDYDLHYVLASTDTFTFVTPYLNVDLNNDATSWCIRFCRQKASEHTLSCIRELEIDFLNLWKKLEQKNQKKNAVNSDLS